MQSATLLLALLTGVVAGTFSVDLHKQRVPTRNSTKGKGVSGLYARGLANSIVPDPLVNWHTPYSAVIYVGSNSQRILLPIDTSLSDLWIESVDSHYCSKADCTNLFNTDLSSTYQNVSGLISLTMLPTWFSHDTVQIGDAILSNASFIADQGPGMRSPYLGLAFRATETTISQEGDKSASDYGKGFTYPNIPEVLKQQGYIDTISISLYMNSEGADGQLLFGGVDHSKYVGNLGKVPLVNIFSDPPSQFIIMLHGVGIGNEDAFCDLAGMDVGVLLASDSPYSMIPDGAVKAMGEVLSFDYDRNYGACFGSCNVEIPFEYFTFDFSGIRIKIPAKELLGKAVDILGNPVLDSNGQQKCMLALFGGNTPTDYVLGENLFRFLYMAFDMENLEIAIAQAKPGAVGDSDIEPITSKLPGTPAPSYYSTLLAWDAWNCTDYQSCLRTSTTRQLPATTSSATPTITSTAS